MDQQKPDKYLLPPSNLQNPPTNRQKPDDYFGDFALRVQQQRAATERQEREDQEAQKERQRQAREKLKREKREAAKKQKQQHLHKAMERRRRRQAMDDSLGMAPYNPSRRNDAGKLNDAGADKPS